MKYQTERIEIGGEVFEGPALDKPLKLSSNFGDPYRWAGSEFGRASEYRKNLLPKKVESSQPKEMHIVLDLRLDNVAWTREHASSEDYKVAHRVQGSLQDSWRF